MEPKYAMIIDAGKCINCKACIVSCQLENRVLPFFQRNWIKSAFFGPGKGFHFQPGNCMQCDAPSCVEACPVGATFKTENGIVVIDPNTCIGCGNCIPACPYGARYRHPERHIADKCDFCRHRLKRGLEPACVDVCPTRARIFGDLNDPASEISQLFKQENLVQVKNVKIDTQPNIYYLAGTRPLNWPHEPTLPGDVHMPPAFWSKTA